MYATETRSEAAKTQQILWVADSNTLRSIIGKIRLDQVRNTNVRRQCDISYIIKFYRK